MIISIICYHYAKHRSKQKGIDVEQYKIENSKIKKVRIENCKCYYFEDIIKLGDFDIDNILIDEYHMKIF